MNVLVEKNKETKAPINQTKVGEASESFKASTETQNTHTENKPLTKPHSDPNTPKPKVKSLDPKTDVINTKKISNFLKQNHGKIALGAIGVGVAKSFIDNEDDDVLSSAGKGIKTGILAAGLSYGGEHLFKSATVQNLVKGEVTDMNKTMLSQRKLESRLNTIGAKLPGAAKIGLYALAGTTLLDLGMKGVDRLEARKAELDQEWKLKEKQRKKKNRQRELSYAHLNDGDIVLGLFDDRTGHYKMGNAKYN